MKKHSYGLIEKNRGKHGLKFSGIFIAFVLSILVLCFETPETFASSISPNYVVNDETINFAVNSEFLKGTNFNMDLGAISWVSRPMQSSSYVVVDANSDMNPVLPPPPPPSGGVLPDVGGRIEYEDGEVDVPGVFEKDEYYLDLHEAPEPEREPELDPGPEKGEVYYEDILLHGAPLVDHDYDLETSAGDDTDGCSTGFEMKFMKTDPNKNDTDNDGLEDCDEYLVYGLNPFVFNDDYKRVGISRPEFIHTEFYPFFVGRADYGQDHLLSDKMIQIQLTKSDPLTEYGLFFIKLREDLNFADVGPIELEDGLYETAIFIDGNKYENDYNLRIDSSRYYESLVVDSPMNNILVVRDGLIRLSGRSGSEYGIVAIWSNEKKVDVTAVLADKDGYFEISAPESYNDGDYEVTLYALLYDDGDLVQTNYDRIIYKIENGTPYVLERIKNDQIAMYLTSGFDGIETDFLKTANLNKDNVARTNILSLGLIVSFMLLTFFGLCNKRGL